MLWDNRHTDTHRDTDRALPANARGPKDSFCKDTSASGPLFYQGLFRPRSRDHMGQGDDLCTRAELHEARAGLAVEPHEQPDRAPALDHHLDGVRDAACPISTG